MDEAPPVAQALGHVLAASFSDLKIVEFNFPSLSCGEAQDLVGGLQKAIPEPSRVIALARVLAAIDKSAIRRRDVTVVARAVSSHQRHVKKRDPGQGGAGMRDPNTVSGPLERDRAARVQGAQRTRDAS